MALYSGNFLGQDAQCIAPTYAKANLDFVKGNGSWLETADGTQYLDFMSGIAVNALGHQNEAIRKAVIQQLHSYSHISNLFPNEPQIELAQKMLELTGLQNTGKAFFCNSGTEANEGAIKFARKYFAKKGESRVQIVTFLNSFHGRTYGALSATGQSNLQKDFGPMLEGFVHVPWNDCQALRDVVSEQTCAIMLEPIIAEGGILTPSQEFVQTINELRKTTGCLVIADEIQTGLGRCGSLQGTALYGLDYDLSTWAKALGGGFPLGLVLMRNEIAEQLQPGDHGTTFGGNPYACAAGLAVAQVISAPGFMEQVQQRSQELTEGLQALAKKFSWLGELRGAGLIQGIVSQKPVADVITACRAEQLLVLRAGADVIRLLPPLTISAEELQDGLLRLEKALAKL